MIRVTVWNEYVHETKEPEVARIYPQGIHGCLAAFLDKDEEIQVRTALLQEPENGLTEEVLEQTDVLIWWGHLAHYMVQDDVAHRVKQHVLRGMGFIALHSAHFSKPFASLLGSSCRLNCREGEDFERLWTVLPGHPIAYGVDKYVELPHEEMYGEHFDIPQPDELVFLGWFSGGEVFRSGCCWHRGLGRIFYFQPGHETYPTYHIPEIQQILTNAVHWAAPVRRVKNIDCQYPPLESYGDCPRYRLYDWEDK